MQDIEKIYEEYFETVNKYLFCLTHNNDISEELTQETFYRVSSFMTILSENLKNYIQKCDDML